MKCKKHLLTALTFVSAFCLLLAFFCSENMCVFAENAQAFHTENKGNVTAENTADLAPKSDNVTQKSILLPWNSDVTFYYGNVCFRYNLSAVLDATPSLTKNAQNRAFFSGKKGKMQLLECLLQQQFSPAVAGEYVFPEFGEILVAFSAVEQQRIDASATFDSGVFSYKKGQDGVKIDVEKVAETLCNYAGKGAQKVLLPVQIDRAVTVETLRKNTVKKASFRTTFSSANSARCANIARAVASLNNTVVPVGEAFSFNKTVGPRTEENGYKTAKVILNGEYVDGVGGGVCQVSTTLYNTLLLSEITICEAHAHTLVSHYVDAGFDAMVSYPSADLRFVNGTNAPLYIYACVSGNSVTCTVYGVPNRYKVVRESVAQVTPFETTYVTDAKLYPNLVYTDETQVVTSGSDGVKSKSYLLFYDGDKLVQRQLLRTDSYKKVNKVVARGWQNRPQNLQTESFNNGN